MRKFILTAAVILAAVLFTSCSGRLDPDDLDFYKAFTFDARLEYNGSGSAANFSRTAAGTWTGTLTEPYALQGVKVDFSPSEMTVSYSDFAVRYGGDAPPDFNITAFVMFGALENAFGGRYSTVYAGKDGFEITGIADGDNYVLRLDKDGLPTSLEVPGQQLKAVFTGVEAKSF